MEASKDHIKPVSALCKYFFYTAINPLTVVLSAYPPVL